MKQTKRKKKVQRKYKRLMAALAGAAVVTSAMLPGLPIANAATNTVVASPAPEASATAAGQRDKDHTPAQDSNQNRAKDRDHAHPNNKPQLSGSPVDAVKKSAASHGFDARRDTFTLQWQSSSEAVVQVRTTKGKTFIVRLTAKNGAWKIDSVKESRDRITKAGDPINVVKSNAAIFGFDALRDHFTLLSASASKAIVQVRTSGQTFKVDLEKSSGRWIITTIRGIGNSKYPATFRPASMYGYVPDSASRPIINIQQTLYSNNEFSGWSWNEGAYPGDMKMGIVLSTLGSPKNAGIPSIIVDKIDSINFSRQIAVYAYIGSVAEKGYGIGIEKVVQTDNTLTVTIRTKSPLENYRLPPTKTNDVITIDRALLNSGNTFQIKFVDQKGAVLGLYTVTQR